MSPYISMYYLRGKNNSSKNIQNRIPNNSALNGKDQILLYILPEKDMNRRKSHSIKKTSVYQFLSFVFLQSLLLLYILNRYKNIIIQQRIALSPYMFRKGPESIRIQTMLRARNRILTDMAHEKKKSLERQTVLEEKQRDWTFGLPPNTIKHIDEYNSKVHELRNRIFLNNVEFDLFLKDMMEKKKIVETYAPMLLNKHEEEDIRNAKVLQYYTLHHKHHSKIIRFLDSLSYYIVLLHFFKGEWLATTESDKIRYRKRTEYYTNFLKKVDIASLMVIKLKLVDIQCQLMPYVEDNHNSNVDSLFENEFATIHEAHFIGTAYRNLLKRIQELGTSYDEPINRLYYMEQRLASITPHFFALYKWKKIS